MLLGGGKVNEGSKGGGVNNAPKAPTLSKCESVYSKEKSIKAPTIKKHSRNHLEYEIIIPLSTYRRF